LLAQRQVMVPAPVPNSAPFRDAIWAVKLDLL
jgi:hypothetical protein